MDRWYHLLSNLFFYHWKDICIQKSVGYSFQFFYSVPSVLVEGTADPIGMAGWSPGGCLKGTSADKTSSTTADDNGG